MINNRVKLLASRCLLRYTTAVSTRNFDFCALSTQYSPTACSRTAPRPRSPPSTGTRIWHWVSRVIHTDKRAGLAADMFANETTISLGKRTTSESMKTVKERNFLHNYFVRVFSVLSGFTARIHEKIVISVTFLKGKPLFSCAYIKHNCHGLNTMYILFSF